MVADQIWDAMRHNPDLRPLFTKNGRGFAGWRGIAEPTDQTMLSEKPPGDGSTEDDHD